MLRRRNTNIPFNNFTYANDGDDMCVNVWKVSTAGNNCASLAGVHHSSLLWITLSFFFFFTFGRRVTFFFLGGHCYVSFHSVRFSDVDQTNYFFFHFLLVNFFFVYLVLSSWWISFLRFSNNGHESNKPEFKPEIVHRSHIHTQTVFNVMILW